MFGSWSYLAGVATVLGLAAAGLVVARAVSGPLVPAWTGALAGLVGTTVGIGFVVVVSEVLGSFGEFRRWPLLATAVILALGIWRVLPRAPVSGAPVHCRAGRVELAVAGGVVALVLGPWVHLVELASRQGMINDDTLSYHLPAATSFAQSGSVTHLLYFGDSSHSFLPFARSCSTPWG